MRKVEHYLLTIPLEGGHFHGYVMTNDPRMLRGAVKQMMDVIETQRLPMQMPIVLETKLDTGVDIVRGIVISHMPEAAKSLAEATDFHFTAFLMRTHDNPDNDRLMELH